MFERFTERARQVIILAQEEARTQGCAEISSGHLLAGLILEGSGLAAQVLAENDVTIEAVRHHLEGLKTPGSPTGQIPFSTIVEKGLEYALREALSLGHNYIGTEHILLGASKGFAWSDANLILNGNGLNYDKLRALIIEKLDSPGRRTPQVEKETKAKMVDVYDSVDHEQLTAEIAALLFNLAPRHEDVKTVTLTKMAIERQKEFTFERLVDSAGNVHYIRMRRK